MNKPQTIIIGGGPAGASAAIYLARFFDPVTLIDAPFQVHGRTSMATSLENFLTNENPVTGKEFLTRISNQLNKYPIERVYEKVIRVSRPEQKFIIETDKQSIFESDYLVIAVGLSDIMPKIDGLGPYFDNSIFHCLMCDWYRNRDKKIAVVSNTDDGLETALMINFMHRPPLLSVVPSKEDHSFSKNLVTMAESNNVLVFRKPITEVIGENGYLQKIGLTDGTRIEAEVLFTRLGYDRFDYFLDEGKIFPDRNERGFIKVDFKTFESSVKNLFAIGPCNDGPDQAIIAAGEGALTATEIHDRIIKSGMDGGFFG
jgi:thioredoxin reductase (NADPH)